MSSIRGKRLMGVLLAAVLAGASIFGVSTAVSKSGGGKIKPVARSDKGARNLAKAIFQGNPKRLANSKFVAAPPGNKPIGVSTKKLAGFPQRGGSYAILTTGCARLADNKNKSASSGCRDGGLKVRGARDVTIWRIRVQVPRGKNCLSFRFKFLSEEYPEFVKSEYNDAFIAEWGGAPRWNAGSKTDPKILARHNFATTGNGKLISANAAGVARMSRGPAKGTTYDGATRKLRASTRVKPGKHLLHLSIFDQGDRQYDSAVFIDRLKMRHAAKSKCKSGVVRSN